MKRISVHRLRSVVTGTLLGFLLLWCCAGGALWQSARSLHYQWVRMEAERKVKDTITLCPDADVVWLEKDELRYEGRMFDVKKRIQKGDVVMLVGHYDETDDYLFASLRKMFGSDAHTRRKNSSIPIFLPEAVLEEVVPLSATATDVAKRTTGLMSDVFLPSIPLPVAEAPPDDVRSFHFSYS